MGPLKRATAITTNQVDYLLLHNFESFPFEETLDIKRLSANPPSDIVINGTAGQK